MAFAMNCTNEIYIYNKPRLTMTSIICGLLLSMSATNIYAESLLQVYQHAKANDTQLKVSELGLLAALEAKPQAISDLKPQVTVAARANYGLNYTGRSFTRDDGSAFFNLGYELTLSQSLINKQLDAQIEQVDASILQFKVSLESDRQDLIIRVAEAYFAFLNAKESLAFRKSEAKAIGKQLNQAKAFFEAGRSAITGVKEAQARYDLANAQISVANQQIDVSIEALRAITAHHYKTLQGASSQIPLLIPAPNNIEAWTKVAIANSKQLLVAKYGVYIAQSNIDIQHAARKPVLNMVAQHGSSSTFGENTIARDVIDGSIGLQLSMPLFDGGSISSRVRQARLLLQQARQQLELQKRLAVQQSRAAYLTIISGLAQVKALRQALNSTQAASNATQAGFEAGTRTATDVLVSLRETFSARRDYSFARYSFLLNTLRLKQAVGTLSETDLAAISKLLNETPA